MTVGVGVCVGGGEVGGLHLYVMREGMEQSSLVLRILKYWICRKFVVKMTSDQKRPTVMPTRPAPKMLRADAQPK